MPWFLWIMLVGWIIGIAYIVYNEFIYPEHTGLEGWADYCCSVVIVLLWPVWGIVMLYFRFKPTKKVKHGTSD